MARQSAEPPVCLRSLSELVGVAHAVGTETARRYSQLAKAMHRRGDAETARAFEAMAGEEQSHVAAVEGWARRLGEPVPDEANYFRWRLPAQLAESWDEVAGSALLTPYRAYAIAVHNKRRAFVFFVYLAASADDPAIARAAEVLACNELQHAALLRTWRRVAWRREAGEASGAPVTSDAIRSIGRFAEAICAAEAEIAACQSLLARRLRNVGDEVSARLLESLAGEAAARTTLPTREHCGAEACKAVNSVGLLMAAQRPLETMCGMLENTLTGSADEALQVAAEEALSNAVARISRLGRRIEALQGRPAPK